ncbi:beta-ketoacyl synthase N-terminal-like domain-containing protein [Anaeromicropila populeti]|uniref:Ketoacyl-synthetase C-terminal extension n=1 Tax=Anaeromicropila populeti TaxID=37658 RepID=A0A1I6LZ61_9FIRM|nr:polyketide synthase [Anaeromicropila populeti]SFS08572.1 Ketoacyl-synthetase C-terminal extension [Anaeromicropila populeti]
MYNVNDISKYILQELKQGNISKDAALNLVKKLNMKDEIAIIGMGCRLKDTEDYEEYWDTIVKENGKVHRCQKSRIDLIRSNMPSSTINEETKFSKGSYMDGLDMFDYSFFGFKKEEADYLPPSLRISLEVVYRALEDAGYLGEQLQNNKMSVFLGNNFTKDTYFSYLKMCLENQFYSIPLEGNLFNITSGLATRIAGCFDLKGMAYMVDASCPSAAVAIHNACTAIKTKQCSTAIAGGMLFDLTPIKRCNMSNWIFLHPDDVITKMFDENPGGGYIGEGMGVLVLKSLKEAIEDGDSIHGIISGMSFNNNGSDGNFTQSCMEDVKTATVNAFKDAQVDVNDIGFLIDEGYPNKMEQGIELSGLIAGFNRFTNKKQFCGLGGIANYGYLQSSIGVFSMMLCSLALKKKIIPPVYHFCTPTDAVNLCRSPFYVSDIPKEWICQEGHSRYAVSHIYGYGGTNMVFVLKEPPAVEKKEKREREQELFILTTKTKKSMLKMIEQYITFLSEEKDVNLLDICYTASTKRMIFREYRLAIAAHDVQDLIGKLKMVLRGELNSEEIVFAEHEVTEKEKNTKIRYTSVSDKTLCEIAAEFGQQKSFLFGELYQDCGAEFCKIPKYIFDRESCWVFKDKNMNQLKFILQNIKAGKSTEQGDNH